MRRFAVAGAAGGAMIPGGNKNNADNREPAAADKKDPAQGGFAPPSPAPQTVDAMPESDESKAERKRLTLLADVGELIRTTSHDSDLLYRVASAVGKHFEAQRCLFNEIDL